VALGRITTNRASGDRRIHYGDLRGARWQRVEHLDMRGVERCLGRGFSTIHTLNTDVVVCFRWRVQCVCLVLFVGAGAVAGVSFGEFIHSVLCEQRCTDLVGLIEPLL